DAFSETPVAMVPTGTANVVSRELDLPKDLKSQVLLAMESDLRRLDLGCVGQRRFMMCVGAGFDAAIVHAMAWKRPGRGITLQSYLPLVMGEARRYPFPPMRVTVDGVLVEEYSVFTVVGNMSRYGGPFRMFKNASPEDGLLDVCCLQGRRLIDLARYAWLARWGRLQKGKGVNTHRGKEVILEADERIPLQIDGDPGGELPAILRILPGAISFCVPFSRDF
ncbi:MAG: hypothetical protein JW821_11860, partial [Deltaproteobacteria bacterium]|nr:hypothetical protein [Deltaproteobacteria bacterium]